MKYLCLPLLLFSLLSVGHAQTVLPYDLSWAHFPFSEAYSQVERLSARTFLGKKDLKKGIPHTIEEVYFDNTGRATQENRNFYPGGGICWKYASDGCPSKELCEPDSNQTPLRQRFTCHDGKVDTIFGVGGLLKVLHYDEAGRERTTIQFQKDKDSGSYEFLDSTLSSYDGKGRYAGFKGPDYEMKVRYLQDSIVIERFQAGILKSTWEIKCGRYGLPVLMQTWVYSERRNKKKSLWLNSTLEYEFRE